MSGISLAGHLYEIDGVGSEEYGGMLADFSDVAIPAPGRGSGNILSSLPGDKRRRRQVYVSAQNQGSDGVAVVEQHIGPDVGSNIHGCCVDNLGVEGKAASAGGDNYGNVVRSQGNAAESLTKPESSHLPHCKIKIAREIGIAGIDAGRISLQAEVTSGCVDKSRIEANIIIPVAEVSVSVDIIKFKQAGGQAVSPNPIAAGKNQTVSDDRVSALAVEPTAGMASTPQCAVKGDDTAIHPNIGGCRIYPAAHPAGNIVVNYGTIHDARRSGTDVNPPA